jgi:hypothetical protein
MRGKDLPANPCREMRSGGLCQPLKAHLKRDSLQTCVVLKYLSPATRTVVDITRKANNVY